ncbi:MAG: efflux RND transporter periplasmic adaptor subunit [Gammaproteobacteria bacterium]|nr:efflux RND transporter periplasmic adaptor subunit [Gammaproteobacteria bacterium]
MIRLHLPRAMIFVLAPVLISVFILPSLRAADGPPSAPVVVAVAKQQAIAPSSWFFGSVYSRSQANIASEITGRLLEVAEVGKQVKQGDVLARIDASAIKLQYDELRAQITSEQARLTFFSSEVERLQQLAKTNHAARTQLEQTQSDRDATQGALAAARSRFAQAKDRVERSAIKAPFDGTVAQRLLQPGEWADSGAAIVELIDINSLEVRVRIPLSSMRYIQADTSLRVKSANDQVLATLRSLVPVGDIASRLADLRLNFQHPAWRPGQSVRVSIPTGAAKQSLVVPRDALVLRANASRVYRINDDELAEPVDVILGDADGKWIEVNGDLAAGDRVVIRGGERLRPGQKVTIQTAGQTIGQSAGQTATQ